MSQVIGDTWKVSFSSLFIRSSALTVAFILVGCQVSPVVTQTSLEETQMNNTVAISPPSQGQFLEFTDPSTKMTMRGKVTQVYKAASGLTCFKIKNENKLDTFCSPDKLNWFTVMPLEEF